MSLRSPSVIVAGALAAAAALVPGQAAATSTAAAVTSSPPLSYYSEAPGRLVDTRIGSPNFGVPKGRIPAYGSLAVLPFDSSGRQAVVLSLTVIRPLAYGSLAVGPTKTTATTALSFSPGEIRTQAVTTLTTEGREGFVVYNHSAGTLDLVIDETGFFSSYFGGNSGPGFDPRRIADTRTGLGVARARVSPRGVLFVPTGQTGPAILWVTVTGATASGWLSAASGISTSTSMVSFAAGETVTATTSVTAADTGTVTLFNGSSGSIDVVVDLEASVGGAGSRFVAQSPWRLADTRTGLGTGGSTTAVAPHTSLVVKVAGDSSPVPTGSYGAALSVTVTQPTGRGYLKVASAAGTSAVSFTPGRTATGLALAGLSTGGTVSIYNGSFGTLHLVVDVEGYFLRPVYSRSVGVVVHPAG